MKISTFKCIYLTVIIITILRHELSAVVLSSSNLATICTITSKIYCVSKQITLIRPNSFAGLDNYQYRYEL